MQEEKKVLVFLDRSHVQVNLRRPGDGRTAQLKAAPSRHLSAEGSIAGDGVLRGIGTGGLDLHIKGRLSPDEGLRLNGSRPGAGNLHRSGVGSAGSNGHAA